MGMTKHEQDVKNYIGRKQLVEKGYVTYAELFKEFDLNLTSRPDVIAYMEPGKGRIVINKTLTAEQASVVIRHEILHAYLQHELRLLKKIAKDRGLDYDALTDMNIKDLKKEVYKDDVFNYAADYEISNRGYTENDKKTMRRLQVGERIVSGLVTEDRDASWVNLSLEEMYEKLRKEKDEQVPEEQIIPGILMDNTTFKDINGTKHKGK